IDRSPSVTGRATARGRATSRGRRARATRATAAARAAAGARGRARIWHFRGAAVDPEHLVLRVAADRAIRVNGQLDVVPLLVLTRETREIVVGHVDMDGG